MIKKKKNKNKTKRYESTPSTLMYAAHGCMWIKVGSGFFDLII